MAQELTPIEITDTADLLRIAEEVRRSGQPRLLRREGEDLAVLTPAAKPTRRSGRAKPVTKDDPLFSLIGIGRSSTPGGMSGRKHEALARAYRPKPIND